MSQTYFKLVEGTFKKDDARRILLSLINSKINFHSLEAFRRRETGSETSFVSEKRLKELLDTKQKMMDWVDPLPDAQTQITIKGNLEVTFHD